MKVIDVSLVHLQGKHYSTDVCVTVSVEGREYNLLVSVAGYAPKASSREKERGWEPDWGMDHTESETHLSIAQTIVDALAELTGGKDD